MLEMPILMSISKLTQVLSTFYFRDTPEQDQRALRTIGSKWPNWRDKTGLAVWPGVGGNFFTCSTAPRWQCGLWGGLSNGTVLPMTWGLLVTWYHWCSLYSRNIIGVVDRLWMERPLQCLWSEEDQGQCQNLGKIIGRPDVHVIF